MRRPAAGHHRGEHIRVAVADIAELCEELIHRFDHTSAANELSSRDGRI
jgi:hypothetical protein